MSKVTIDGIEYVPNVSIQPVSDDALLVCIRELVGIQYFYNQTHKHRAWAWDALNAVSPQLAELCANDPPAAMEAVGKLHKLRTATTDALDRLVELEEVRFHKGRPYWASCGQYLGSDEDVVEDE